MTSFSVLHSLSENIKLPRDCVRIVKQRIRARLRPSPLRYLYNIPDRAMTIGRLLRYLRPETILLSGFSNDDLWLEHEIEGSMQEYQNRFWKTNSGGRRIDAHRI